jgi:hypothetical protein
MIKYTTMVANIIEIMIHLYILHNRYNIYIIDDENRLFMNYNKQNNNKDPLHPISVCLTNMV